MVIQKKVLQKVRSLALKQQGAYFCLKHKLQASDKNAVFLRFKCYIYFNESK